MPRYDQVIRQWTILKLLEANGRVTLRRIASELDGQCHERTLRRDLDVLSLSGFPIHTEREDSKTYWVLDEAYRRFPIPLTPTELLALQCGGEFLKPLDGTFLAGSFHSLLQKARAGLTPQSREYLGSLQKTFSVGTMPHKSYHQYQDQVEKIKTALEQGFTLQIRYVPLRTSRVTSRRVDPYALWYQNGGLYLIGHDHLRKALRTFAVDRIRSLQVTDTHFQMPLYFSIHDYFKDAFGVFHGKPEEVELIFEKKAARWVKERQWHSSQRITPLKDGKIRMNLRVAGSPELLAWVLGFGAQVRVIKPESLKKAVQNEAWKLLGKYQGITMRRRSTKARIVAGRRKAVGGV
ncbi:MAG TPA: helix-turn-helix transcriptional regulator [Candidatus Avalokitesvara rifleensis]|uniref:helix-turn-helix transcriptional regulator n=1 Tax=Candidatus Avalokitesvara rifleensis TaxID=3367620 RepID=UPI004028F08A